MKVFRILLFIFGIGLLLLWGVDYGFRSYMGSDVETLAVESEEFKFTAARDELGVWKIDVETEESLWFSLGYVQTVDREFQFELYRMLARGRLSEWLGESLLSTDRLNRHISRVAKRIWDQLPDTDLSKRAAEAFVKGHNAFIQDTEGAEPLEYLVLQLSRKKIEPLEAWEVFAIARFQSWQHSYDLGGDLVTLGLRQRLGEKLGSFLGQTFSYPDSSMYKQESLLGHVKSRLGGKAPAALWASSDQDRASTAQLYSNSSQELDLSFQSPASLGASNLWIGKAKEADEVSLCNDTHLLFSWPTPLYPVEYNVSKSVKGRGFMLPGAPPMVIGNVEHLEGESVKRSLSWGITIGAFADTQDLVELSSRELRKAENYKENFKVLDLKAMKHSTKSFDEQWTSLGPRVDGLLKKYDLSFQKPLALDWMGFRGLRSPSNFFLKRMLVGVDDLQKDMVEDWGYPSVNYTWMSSSKGVVEAGHILTGTIFERSGRSVDRILNEKEAAARRLSKVSDRPFFTRQLKKSDEFFLNTANQSIFSDDNLNKRLANIWIPPFRNNQILKERSNNHKTVGYSQTDYTVPSFQWFWARVANENPQDLCARVDQKQLCLDVLYGLSRWDFKAEKNSWETSVLSLWMEKFKQSFWTNDQIFSSKEATDLYEEWAMSYIALAFLNQIMTEPKMEEAFQKQFKKSVKENLYASFKESFELLSAQWGVDRQRWTWGRMHFIEWLHPFAKFPPPMNELLMSGMLGKPRSVPGAIDSPGRFQSAWSPKDSLSFPVRHGAALRFCSSVSMSDPQIKLDWSMPAGVSGKAFSKWGWSMSEKFYKD
ncbi:penicillin acylase family protein [bacterium]|nr:penicillin acylase family protein [bacterium]